MIDLNDKIVFLDIDGVLNNYHTKERTPLLKSTAGGWGEGKRRYTGIEKGLAQHVKRILLETDAKLVLSSTWRHHPEMHPYMWNQLGKFIKERYIAKTPELYYSYRGKEIYNFLQEHPYKNFVILDDDMSVRDYFTDKEHIDTNPEGLTTELADLAIKILNKA